MYVGYDLILWCYEYFIGLVEPVQDGVCHPLKRAGILSCIEHLLYLEAVCHDSNKLNCLNFASTYRIHSYGVNFLGFTPYRW